MDLNDVQLTASFRTMARGIWTGERSRGALPANLDLFTNSFVVYNLPITIVIARIYSHGCYAKMIMHLTQIGVKEQS